MKVNYIRQVESKGNYEIEGVYNDISEVQNPVIGGYYLIGNDLFLYENLEFWKKIDVLNTTYIYDKFNNVKFQKVNNKWKFLTNFVIGEDFDSYDDALNYIINNQSYFSNKYISVQFINQIEAIENDISFDNSGYIDEINNLNIKSYNNKKIFFNSNGKKLLIRNSIIELNENSKLSINGLSIEFSNCVFSMNLSNLLFDNDSVILNNVDEIYFKNCILYIDVDTNSLNKYNIFDIVQQGIFKFENCIINFNNVISNNNTLICFLNNNVMNNQFLFEKNSVNISSYVFGCKILLFYDVYSATYSFEYKDGIVISNILSNNGVSNAFFSCVNYDPDNFFGVSSAYYIKNVKFFGTVDTSTNKIESLKLGDFNEKGNKLIYDNIYIDSKRRDIIDDFKKSNIEVKNLEIPIGILDKVIELKTDFLFEDDITTKFKKKTFNLTETYNSYNTNTDLINNGILGFNVQDNSLNYCLYTLYTLECFIIKSNKVIMDLWFYIPSVNDFKNTSIALGFAKESDIISINYNSNMNNLLSSYGMYFFYEQSISGTLNQIPKYILKLPNNINSDSLRFFSTTSNIFYDNNWNKIRLILSNQGRNVVLMTNNSFIQSQFSNQQGDMTGENLSFFLTIRRKSFSSQVPSPKINVKLDYLSLRIE
jgi:hypothetical protein